MCALNADPVLTLERASPYKYVCSGPMTLNLDYFIVQSLKIIINATLYVPASSALQTPTLIFQTWKWKVSQAEKLVAKATE